MLSVFENKCIFVFRRCRYEEILLSAVTDFQLSDGCSNQRENDSSFG